MTDERLARIMEKGFETLADLTRETNSRLDETNMRLDVTNMRLDETVARLDETNTRLGRLEGRFENIIEIAGGETRRLGEDVEDLQHRVGSLEEKAS